MEVAKQDKCWIVIKMGVIFREINVLYIVVVKEKRWEVRVVAGSIYMYSATGRLSG
jgi:hypothetical protein